MMELIKQGKAKHLIVFSFSRFSRSCSHLLKSLEFLEENDCRFTSVSEQIETSTIMGKTLVAGLARAKEQGKHIGRKKTRPSVMIRKVLVRGITYREAAHLCRTSQGSIALEAKEMRQEFRQGKIPKYLTIDDLKHSPFFASENKKYFDLISDDACFDSFNSPPPLPVQKNPIAEMQSVAKVVHRNVA